MGNDDDLLTGMVLRYLLQYGKGSIENIMGAFSIGSVFKLLSDFIRRLAKRSQLFLEFTMELLMSQPIDELPIGPFSKVGLYIYRTAMIGSDDLGCFTCPF